MYSAYDLLPFVIFVPERVYPGVQCTVA